MKRTRLALVSLFGVAAIALATDPVAAQTSSTAGLINDLNNKLLVAAIPITILTELALGYTVWKFRKNDEPKPTKENRRLEISWTIATAIVLLFVGVASYGVLANENVTFQQSKSQIAPDENDVVIHVEAYQWGWAMTYPDEGGFQAPRGENGPQVVVPNDRDVYFNITSRDVLHSFAVPELGLKQDAIPSQSNVLKTHTNEVGTYQGYCAEFCGVSHSQMYFSIKVVPQDQYQQFLQEQKNQSS
ncbi:MAG: cytochrome c oxidase subunit II [Haloferacaceae archaeon]